MRAECRHSLGLAAEAFAPASCFPSSLRRVNISQVHQTCEMFRLMAAKLAAEQAQEAVKGQRGRLVIGNHGALTIAFLPGVLSRFREQHPLVEVTLLHLNSDKQRMR